MDYEKIIEEAFRARDYSYAPYSGYRVGAALLLQDGGYIRGCNIENASYGLCNCAERSAIFRAVSEGIRGFRAIAIVGGVEEGDLVSDYAFPCGACRQVMREFCNVDDFIIVVAKSVKDYKSYTLNELLPNSFGPDNLN